MIQYVSIYKANSGRFLALSIARARLNTRCRKSSCSSVVTNTFKYAKLRYIHNRKNTTKTNVTTKVCIRKISTKQNWSYFSNKNFT